jgi:hypothetical protein
MATPSQRQINIRLPAKQVRSIETAAFLEDQSIAEYLKPVIDELVARIDEDPAIQTTNRLKAEKAAKREGKLSTIDEKRRTGRSA